MKAAMSKDIPVCTKKWAVPFATKDARLFCICGIRASHRAKPPEMNLDTKFHRGTMARAFYAAVLFRIMIFSRLMGKHRD